MACESDALPAANRARLIELRHLLVSRITMMCARAPSENIQLTVLINIFSGTCDLGELPRCVARVTHVPGSKLSFWAAELTPEYTRPFQIIWCFDNDLDVSKFALHIAARAMIQTGVSLVQPCIPSRRSTNDNTTRTTDIARLRCHRLCSNPIPARGSIRHGGIRCLLKTIYFIEVMTPMWSADGWAVHYEHILSKVPRHMFLESDRGFSETYRGLLSAKLPNRPSTGLLCMPITHHHGRTIDVSNHSHVRVGKAGAPQTILWANQHLRQYRNKGAAGVAPGKCILRVNETTGALWRALRVVNESTPLERSCGEPCHRRNRMSGW